MLVVFSEIRCIDYLNAHGIYPEIFYTDFNLFKNQVITLKDATVLIILAGTCRLNKRLSVDFCKTLRKYRKSDNTGIQHVYVLSDSVITNLDNYHKFVDDIDNITIYNGKKVIEKNNGLITKLQAYNRMRTPCKEYLSDYDKGDTSEIIVRMKKLEEAHKADKENQYENIIQIPNLRQMLAKRTQTS